MIINGKDLNVNLSCKYSGEENAELKELYENSEWWHNRFNAVQRDYENLQQRIDKAIEWVHKHISKYNCKGITIIDWNELSNPNDLLEILGEKENVN